MPESEKKDEKLAEQKLSGIGSVIDGKYELETILGQGGKGTVFGARRLHLGTKLAIKLLHRSLLSDERSRARFQNEARLAMQLEHENIVSVSGFGFSENDEPFIVMELLTGSTLDKVLDEQKKFSLEQFMQMARQLCAAVSLAHKRGVIHRDIKPANVMISYNDKGLMSVKLLDFGLAKSLLKGPLDKNLTQTAVPLGSPAYMSPEQCKSEELDARTDIYSLACVFYECLTGRKLFSGNTEYEVMNKHIYENASFQKHDAVSSRLQAIVLRCLSKDREKRYSDIDELEKELANLLQDQEPAISKSKAALLAICCFVLSVILGFSYLHLNAKKAISSKRSNEELEGKTRAQFHRRGELSFQELGSQARRIRYGGPAYRLSVEEAITKAERASELAEKQLKESRAESLESETCRKFLVGNYCLLEECYDSKGFFGKSRIVLERALEIAKEIGDSEFVIQVYASYMDYYNHSGDYLGNLSFFNRVKSGLRGRALHRLSSRASSASLALKRWREALDLAETAHEQYNVDKGLDKYDAFYRHSFNGPAFGIALCLASALVHSESNKYCLKDILAEMMSMDHWEVRRPCELVFLLDDMRQAGKYDLLNKTCRWIISLSSSYPPAVAMAYDLMIRGAVDRGDVTLAQQLEEELPEQLSLSKLARAQLFMSKAYRQVRQGKKKEALEKVESALKTVISADIRENCEQRFAVLILIEVAAYARKEGNVNLERYALEEIVKRASSDLTIPGLRTTQAQCYLRLAEFYLQDGDKTMAKASRRAAFEILSLMKEQEKELYLETQKKLAELEPGS